STPLRMPLALVLGAEGKGMRQLTKETCDHLARLALPGEIKSLNVSNATALALYVATVQRNGARFRSVIRSDVGDLRARHNTPHRPHAIRLIGAERAIARGAERVIALRRAELAIAPVARIDLTELLARKIVDPRIGDHRHILRADLRR